MKERVICSRFLDECLQASETATDCMNRFLEDFYAYEQMNVLSLEDIKICKTSKDRTSIVKVLTDRNEECFLIKGSKQDKRINTTLKCKINYIGLADVKNKNELLLNNLSKNHVVALEVFDKYDESYDIKCYFDIQKVGDRFWLVSEKRLKNYKGIERSFKSVTPIYLEDVVETTKEFTV